MTAGDNVSYARLLVYSGVAVKCKWPVESGGSCMSSWPVYSGVCLPVYSGVAGKSMWPVESGVGCKSSGPVYSGVAAVSVCDNQKYALALFVQVIEK